MRVIVCLLVSSLYTALAIPLEQTRESAKENKSWKNEDKEHPYISEMYREDLFQGDIVLPKKRNGIPQVHKRWPKGVVTYVIDRSVGSRGRDILAEAFKVFEANTCIRFKQRSSERNYIVIKQPAPSVGCNSALGMTGGAQVVNLAPNCFNTLGTPIHELLHALGFDHEQNRVDRDRYVNIHWDNIKDKMKYNFNVQKGSLTYGAKYDYGSVMHYEARAFSKNGQNTITPKNGANPKILGNWHKMTETDLFKLNAMYNCGNPTGQRTTSKPTEQKCVDDNAKCESWANRNPSECDVNPAYMLNYCKKSCKTCAKVVNCVDQHKTCPDWALKWNPSECEKNPGYMLYNCEKSCGVCGARLGCFNQQSLGGSWVRSDMMSPNYCKRYCKNRRYKYAALKNSNYCYCGNSYAGSGARRSDNECKVQCKGQISMTCGGRERIEVYKV